MAKKKKKSKLNQKIKSVFFTAVLAVAVVGLFSYLILTEKPAAQSDSSRTVAKVNGEKITLEEFEVQYSKLSPQYQALIPREEFLNQMIDKMLILQQAKSADIPVLDSEVESYIGNLKQQFPSEEAFLQVLEEQNISQEELHKQTRESMIIAKMLNQSVLSRIEVTEEDIANYYNMNEGQFTAKQGEIRVAHILVGTEEEANEILAMLKKGANFNDLAIRYSMDPSAETNQGDLGFFSRGVMIQEFEDAAFALKVGEISDPVETSFGFHIIKRLPNKILLQEARESIYSNLVQLKQEEAIEAFLKELREGAQIEVSLDEEEQQTTGVQQQENEFQQFDDPVCREDGRPVIRRYTSSKCMPCKDVEIAFRKAVSQQDVVVKEWELDTGDNLYTQEIESSIPRAEYEILKKYNPSFAVPAYVFGCRYVRIGNAFSEFNVAEEERIFRQTVDNLK